MIVYYIIAYCFLSLIHSDFLRLLFGMQNLALWNLIQSDYTQALAERTSVDTSNDSHTTAIYDCIRLLIALHIDELDDEDSENILKTVCPFCCADVSGYL